MPDANDMDLVREFARNHSEAAFTELVRRHINLVYSVARRCTGTDGDAQDVTQAVFIILARKAAGLREKTLLAGWLYVTTRFTAARLRRTNARRHARELEVYMQSAMNEADTTDVWEKLSPHLEAAMARLAPTDRTLLLLRFYEKKSGSEAAAALGIREDAAHKRLARALEKLRKFFNQRGITLSAAAIAAAVSTYSVQAAPMALAKSVTAVALAQGAAATTSTLTLVTGALKMMTWSKINTAIVAGAAILLAVITGTIVSQAVKHNQKPQINVTPLQIHIKTSFMEVAKKSFVTPDASGTNHLAKITGILNSEQTSQTLQLLKTKPGFEILGEPEVVITSGHLAQMRTADKNGDGPMIELVPALLADGYTIKMKMSVSGPASLSATVNMFDGQTVILSATDQTHTDKQLIVFVIATIVDATGNRLHPKGELPFAQKGIPPQK